MTHFSEEDLIAYHLHECSNEEAVERHLEHCSDCAAVSDSIAETLRIFSSDPVPQPDLDRNWQRLRGNLSVLTPETRRSFFSRFAGWPAVGIAAAALLLVVVFVGLHVVGRDHERVAALLPALQRMSRHSTPLNGHGPLTTEPADPAMANHLDAAERLLTEVNHTSGPLDPEARAEAHQLLLKNAVYVSTARQQGDFAQAAVLDDLGRVLTTLDHEPATHNTLQLRFEMNTSGLLLDIRILRQNAQPQ